MHTGPFTLAIDIGGSSIKAAVLDRDGRSIAVRLRSPTPKPATPAAVLCSLDALVAQLPPFDRISAGFPGVVKGGTVFTAANLGTRDWVSVNLIDALAGRFRVPARALNDAAVQGLGAVEGHGLECVITLGTGAGCALFRNRRLLLHLELGYDQLVGQAALDEMGTEAWNARVAESVRTVIGLTSCDLLYIGGGNARKVTFELPARVKIASNTAGVTGGVRLWEPELDELFVGEPNARPHPRWRERLS